MGQDWALANLDGKIRTHLRHGKGSYQLGYTIFEMLRPRKLVNADDVLVETRGSFSQRQPLSRNPKSLWILPNELIDVVFTQLNDWVGLILLSVTCRDLWNIGVRHLIDFSDQRLAKCSAIGQRLIYLGNYNNKKFFPQGLHIPNPELEDLFSWCNKRDSHGDTYYVGIPRVYTDYEDELSIKWKLIGDYTRAIPCSHLLLADLYDRVNIQVLLDRVLPFEYDMPDQSRLVLRNLSKREYVTGAAMVKFNKDMQANARTSVVYPCLGSAVISRIAWSRRSTGSRRRSVMGVWAGDRFDIVDEDEFERGRKYFAQSSLGESEDTERITAEWHDVSREVLAEIEQIIFSPN